MKIGLKDLYHKWYMNKHESFWWIYDSKCVNDTYNWIIYILNGIKFTSESTLRIMKDIKKLIEDMINEIKIKLPKIYSKELIDVIFYEFYTKISYVEKARFLVSEKIEREKVYLNKRLFDLIEDANF